MAKKFKSPFTRTAGTGQMSRPEGAGNFDNMDDVNIVQSLTAKQGTIQHTPVNDTDIVNKKYVDDNETAVGGSDTQVQWNNNGDLDGTDFYWDDTNKKFRWGTHNEQENLIGMMDIISPTDDAGRYLFNVGSNGYTRQFSVIDNQPIYPRYGLETARIQYDKGSDYKIKAKMNTYCHILFTNQYNPDHLTLNTRWGNIILGHTTSGFTLLKSDAIKIQNDSVKLYFGAGDDCSITYDGTDMIIKPDDVGTGNLKIDGQVDINTHKIINVVDPTADQHAATKKYVDDNGGISDIVEDTTPELGGELDAGAHTIGFTQQTATGDGTTTIDWKLGNKFKFTFGAQNETFTFTAPSNPCNILLMMVQDGTGSRTVTWPATVKWPSGTAPTLTTGANTIDIVSFYYDGTNYYGVASLAFS